MTTSIETLTALIAPEVEALGLALVRVALLGGKSDPTLQVMAERAGTRQLTLDDCAALSRRLSERLDEADPIEDAYRLEVSSPGIDRPLTRLADYGDWAGHEARVKLNRTIDGRKQFDGTIGAVNDPVGGGAPGEAVITFEVPKLGQLMVPFDAIERAKLVLTDRLIAATAPLSSEGADRMVHEADDTKSVPSEKSSESSDAGD